MWLIGDFFFLIFHIMRDGCQKIYTVSRYTFFDDKLNYRGSSGISEGMKRNLKELCLFNSLIYVKAWISCPVASDARKNDLILMKQLIQYKKSIYIKKTCMFVCLFVCLSSMHSKTTDPIVMKFCIVVVCTLRKVYMQVTK
jgi:hypothetical protein